MYWKGSERIKLGSDQFQRIPQAVGLHSSINFDHQTLTRQILMGFIILTYIFKSFSLSLWKKKKTLNICESGWLTHSKSFRHMNYRILSIKILSFLLSILWTMYHCVSSMYHCVSSIKSPWSFPSSVSVIDGLGEVGDGGTLETNHFNGNALKHKNIQQIEWNAGN